MEGRPLVRESTLTALHSKSASAKATADKPAAGAEKAEGSHGGGSPEAALPEGGKGQALGVFAKTRRTSPSGRSMSTIRGINGG